MSLFAHSKDKFYVSYKGIWYKYIDYPNKPRPCSGIWVLSTHPWGIETIMEFNADVYRIDQCFDLFFKAQKDRATGLRITQLIGEYDTRVSR